MQEPFTRFWLRCFCVADLPCCGQSRKETLYLTLDIGHPKQALHALRFNIMRVGNPGSQGFVHCKGYLLYCGCTRPDRAVRTPG